MNENEFKYKGKTYVEKPNVGTHKVACELCAFRKFSCVQLMQRFKIPDCNPWRRADKRSVYFVEKVSTKKAKGKEQK